MGSLPDTSGIEGFMKTINALMAQVGSSGGEDDAED